MSRGAIERGADPAGTYNSSPKPVAGTRDGPAKLLLTSLLREPHPGTLELFRNLAYILGVVVGRSPNLIPSQRGLPLRDRFFGLAHFEVEIPEMVMYRGIISHSLVGAQQRALGFVQLPLLVVNPT